MDMVHIHNRGQPPDPPRMGEAAWAAGREVPYVETAVEGCEAAVETTVCNVCHCRARSPLRRKNKKCDLYSHVPREKGSYAPT